MYENRLASFQGAQPIAKRGPSNASSRAPKALHWPHKSLSPADVSSSLCTKQYSGRGAETTELACESRFLLRAVSRQSRQCCVFSVR